MMRGPLFADDYRPQFSGHETFPLRYGWLKKAYESIKARQNDKDNKKVFLSEDAIARFGIGKNMVMSMRHWATITGVLAENRKTSQINITPLGKLLFDDEGLDPYMEHPATLWLIHWNLAANHKKTTWFWVFNHFPYHTFQREHLINGLKKLSQERRWSRVAPTTIKNDVTCFIRTYVPHKPTQKATGDDTLESPLTELGILKSIGKNDGFRFVRGSKTTLGDGVFAYALIDFWDRFFKSSQTLSFEAIAHEPGGPGRVFLLDENDIVDKLVMLEDITQGELRWSETAGLKQVVRNKGLNQVKKHTCLHTDYSYSNLRISA